MIHLIIKIQSSFSHFPSLKAYAKREASTADFTYSLPDISPMIAPIPTPALLSCSKACCFVA